MNCYFGAGGNSARNGEDSLVAIMIQLGEESLTAGGKINPLRGLRKYCTPLKSNMTIAGKSPCFDRKVHRLKWLFFQQSSCLVFGGVYSTVPGGYSFLLVFALQGLRTEYMMDY